MDSASNATPNYNPPSVLLDRKQRQNRLVEMLGVGAVIVLVGAYFAFRKFSDLDNKTVVETTERKSYQTMRSIVPQDAMELQREEKRVGSIQVAEPRQSSESDFQETKARSVELSNDESPEIGSQQQDADQQLQNESVAVTTKLHDPSVTDVLLADDGTPAKILESRCGNCHGHKLVVDGLTVFRHDSLLDREMGYVIPGNLDESLLWQRIAVDQDMPPEDQPPLSEEELSVIENWILSGAPEFGQKPTRSHVSISRIWQAVYDDLETLDPKQAAVTRYISFNSLHNNSFVERQGRFGANVEDQDIALAKAAIAKLLNSLSWQSRLVAPKTIGPDGLLLRFNLEDFGWSNELHWSRIKQDYPYGMSFQLHPDAQLRRNWDHIVSWTGTDLPVVRADWMANALPRSPLYESLLRLPKNLDDLERLLNVDAEMNIQHSNVVRAGFSESGVSQHNRIVERHDARWGSYWKSYDFGSSEGRANIFKFPLGPQFGGNPYSQFAFEHAGGEMIFTLPNGLQGYYLTDELGEPLAVGPINVVRDLKETSGSPEIENALSCMACHKRGIIAFTDSVRGSRSVPFGEARLRVNELYADAETWGKIIEEEQQRFDEAMAELLLPYSASKMNSSEPVFHTVRRYQRDLEIDDIAAELSIEKVEQLKTMIDSNSRLRELGLGPLVNGAAIKRSTWDGQQGSVFKAVIQEIEIAEPLNYGR